MESNKYKVLIIDDESQIRRLLKMALESNDYKVFESDTGRDGLLSVTMNRPDVILLDLGLPDKEGLSVLSQLREWSAIPVIVLTVRDGEQTKIAALDGGADDYITKPFNTGELLARIRVALRRSFKMDESPLFKSGTLSVDLNARIVKVRDEEVKLTATEYSILALMIKYSGRVLTHNFLIKEIWGIHYPDNFQILRVHVAQLRKKIEENPSIPKVLITEPGVGYRLKIISLEHHFC
jgi:Response regulators consisting of a CheY-like receiver domain and a winged-helix DNA-binding domain